MYKAIVRKKVVTRKSKLVQTNPYLPGKASDYLTSLEKAVRIYELHAAICYTRVSNISQNKNENLDNQRKCIEDRCRELGIVIPYAFSDVGSGRASHIDRLNGLKDAIKMAKETGLSIIVTDPTRPIRPNDYHSHKKPGAKTIIKDYRTLSNKLDGVKVITIIDPDSSVEEIKSFQIKNGLSNKKGKGGRKKGSKKFRYHKPDRDYYLPIVIKMKKRGISYRKIAKELELSRTTVFRWLRGFNG